MQERVFNTTQVKRHKKKPKVQISLALAKRMVRTAEVKVVPGHAYIIYECGHVYDFKDDPDFIVYNAKLGRGARCCPVCRNKALLIKYKKCLCGAEHIGKRIQASKCCSSCSSSRKASKGVLTEQQKRKNSHLADPTRYLCIHREACLEKYYQYDAIPCKGCRGYKNSEDFIKDSIK